MSKIKKNSQPTINSHVFFQPTFGNRPESIVGRDGEIEAFMRGLEEPSGSRERCTLFLGQRGMGKTALLLELGDRAKQAGFVVARVTAHEGMPSSIIEQIQLHGSEFFEDEKPRLTGATIGAMGFTVGLTFSEAARQQYGFRVKLEMLCDKLAQKDRGVLILIDEVYSSAAMREVAASYQELIGDRKNIAICMAGLPHAVSEVLNDKVLTFLNRANKVELGLLSVSAIQAYYERAFRLLNIQCSDELSEQAALKTRGMPYLMQLIGYYLVQYTKDGGSITDAILKKAEKAARRDLENNVFMPILAPLSQKDKEFLLAMAQNGESISTAELKARLGDAATGLQTYRKRLLEAGVIEAPRKGELTFAVPYLAEYIRNQAAAAD